MSLFRRRLDPPAVPTPHSLGLRDHRGTADTTNAVACSSLAFAREGQGQDTGPELCWGVAVPLILSLSLSLWAVLGLGLG
jgi:hypothetical protein